MAASQFKSLSNLIQPGDREKQTQMRTGVAAKLNADEQTQPRPFVRRNDIAP